jgi:RNA polymerase sigma-70 factor (ECF subfamily)
MRRNSSGVIGSVLPLSLAQPSEKMAHNNKLDNWNTHTITALLGRWRSGDHDAANELMTLVYEELHQIAAREMRREQSEHTLQTTAVVHEAYLRISQTAAVDWKDRAHFFAVAATQLRRVLVDQARRRRSEKRGGEIVRLSLIGSDGRTVAIDERLLALDEALGRLESLDPRAAKAVEDVPPLPTHTSNGTFSSSESGLSEILL